MVRITFNLIPVTTTPDGGLPPPNKLQAKLSGTNITQEIRSVRLKIQGYS